MTPKMTSTRNKIYFSLRVKCNESRFRGGPRYACADVSFQFISFRVVIT